MVETANDGVEAVKKMEQAVPGQYDLILMDILLDDHSNGLEGAARIKKERPGIKIIAMTSMAEKSWLSRARKTGIESFRYK